MITPQIRSVFHCRCERCGWEWDADTKPDRCAKCKSRTWNGEDRRSPDPFDPNGQSPWTQRPVPIHSRIEAGSPPPQRPSLPAMLDTFVEAREIIDKLIADNGGPDDNDNRGEVEVLARIDRHIAKLKKFAAAKKLMATA